MALITQFAQPGMYVAQGLAGVRENRLAMAAQEAERATERAQQDAIRNILGASGQAPRGIDAPAVDPAMAAAEAAGVPGVGLGPAPAAGGGAGGVQSPSQPQAPSLPYTEDQIRGMLVYDPQRATGMRAENAAAATANERQVAADERNEARRLADADSAARRITGSPDPDAQRPASVRAFAEQHNIPLDQAEEIIRRREQMVAAPADPELARLMRLAGIDPNSAQGRAAADQYLQRRIAGDPTPGMYFEIDGQGNPTLITGGSDAISGGITAATASRMLENQINTITGAEDVLARIDLLEEAVAEAGPGSSGWLRGFRELGRGALNNLEEIASHGGEGAEFARAAFAIVDDARTNSDLSQSSLNSFFSNEVSGVGLALNLLAYDMAKSVSPDNRVTDLDFRNMLRNLDQMSDPQRAVALRTLRRDQTDKTDRARRRLRELQGQTAAPAAPAAQGDNEFSGMSDDELRRIAGGGG